MRAQLATNVVLVVVVYGLLLAVDAEGLDVTTVLLYPLASIGIVVVGAFVVQLLLAPVRLYREAQTKVIKAERERERARDELEARAQRREIRDALGRFMETGQELQERPVGTHEGFEKWQADANAWLNATANWIGSNLSMADRTVFFDTTGMLAARMGGSFNDEHNNGRLAVARHTSNLRGILEREAA